MTLTATTKPASPADIVAMMQDNSVRSALVVAHPAHEVRVYEWMTRSTPFTYTLTTGSRSGDDRTRFEASRHVMRDAGAKVVGRWGGVEDREFYAWLLSGEIGKFVALTTALADEFASNGVSLVVTDSWQLYNVAHDLTHVIVRAAAKLTEKRRGSAIAVVDYPVVPRALAPQAPLGEEILRFEITPAQYQRKHAAMEHIPLIAVEVEQILREEGESALRTETYTLPASFTIEALTPSFVPYYETYGEERVRSGLYREVIRWAHVQPVVHAVLALVD
jgi:hypothetical protein